MTYFRIYAVVICLIKNNRVHVPNLGHFDHTRQSTGIVPVLPCLFLSSVAQLVRWFQVCQLLGLGTGARYVWDCLRMLHLA